MTSRPHEDLGIFVDRLFSGHRKTKAVLELRDEVLSNLEAKVEPGRHGIFASGQPGDSGY